MSGQPLSLLVSAKISAHWFFSMVPLIVLCPLIAILFSFSGWETEVLMLSLLCGTPALLFLLRLAAAFEKGLINVVH